MKFKKFINNEYFYFIEDNYSQIYSILKEEYKLDDAEIDYFLLESGRFIAAIGRSIGNMLSQYMNDEQFKKAKQKIKDSYEKEKEKCRNIESDIKRQWCEYVAEISKNKDFISELKKATIRCLSNSNHSDKKKEKCKELEKFYRKKWTEKILDIVSKLRNN